MSRARKPTPTRLVDVPKKHVSAGKMPKLARFLNEQRVSLHHLSRCTERAVSGLRNAFDRGQMSYECCLEIKELFEAEGIALPAKLFTTTEGVDCFALRPLRRLSDGRTIAARTHSPLSRDRVIARRLSIHQICPKENPVKPVLTPEAETHFKLDHDPWSDDIRSRDDVFDSPDHAACLAFMEKAARRKSFVAVIGQVGAGKTLVKKDLQRRLSKNFRLIEPQFPDKRSLTPNNLLDAILLTLSAGDKVSLPSHRERKGRRVFEALSATTAQGENAVLLLDEAHDFNREAIRSLKRLHEMQDGYEVLLSIILMGQPELHNLLEDVTLREVSQRVRAYEMRGLNGCTPEYLDFKLKRAGSAIGKIFDPQAVADIEDICKETRTRGPYPLMLHLVCARCMNLAAETGVKLVNRGIVDRIRSTEAAFTKGAR
jgi:type II secretory pathway predicted ATPase ExeA